MDNVQKWECKRLAYSRWEWILNEEFRYGDCLDMKVYVELFTIRTRKLGTRGRSISKTRASGQIHELRL